MAGTTVDSGTGTTIVFGTTAFTSSLLSVNGASMSRESLETSHMATSVWKTFLQGDLTDPGSFEVELHFDPDQAPPLTTVAEVITVTFPLFVGDSTPAKWAASGFMTDFSFTDALETVMTATATIKLTSTVTFTAAA